jgi:ankyrin repeat protein
VADVEALIELVKSGELGKVRALLSENFLLASQRLANGESPLMAALYRGHHDIVDALIEAGAEIDVFAAAATGRVDDLRRALEQEGAVNARAYDGWTPLHLAAFFGHLEAARILLDAGADVDALSQNALGNTPLHAATAGRHSHVALALIERGANPHAVDAGGYTPLQIATQNQLQAVVERMTGTRN